MKASQMFIFFGIVFTVYGLINYYIIRRGLSVVPAEYKTIFLVVTIFIAASYIAGRVLENIWISPISIVLVWIGSFWLAIMTYTFLFLLVIDIKKSAGGLKSLNLAIASDLHLGTINSYEFMYKVGDKLNSMNPDLILLAGDIIDEDLGPVIKYDVGEHLKRLKAKYGVYAVTGNHEYIGGADPAVEYLHKHDINVIRDSVVKIDNAFYIVGREDRSSRQFGGKQRKELSDIMKEVDKSLPVIMMDHQPFNLEQAAQNGVDLQLSGHTHNGQLWPFNYIVEKVYELAWGYKVIGNTHYYVSCGVGGWGPPIRTGSRPEIINIKLNFVGDAN